MAHAVITGGSSGIGFALACNFVRRGFSVSLIARDPSRLADARKRLRAQAGSAKVLTCEADVGDPDLCKRAVQHVIAAAGPPSVAIACAGIVRPTRFLDQPLSAHLEQMRTNYFGSLNFASELVPPMIARGGGNLVFVASAAALAGLYGYSGYGASKFAVRGLAEALRVELAGEGIIVSIVYAPDTDTPQLAAERDQRSPITDRIASAGGVWSAEDVAAAIVRGIDRGQFAIVPGWPVRLLHLLQGVVGPAFRWRQQQIVRSMSQGRSS